MLSIVRLVSKASARLCQTKHVQQGDLLTNLSAEERFDGGGHSTASEVVNTELPDPCGTIIVDELCLLILCHLLDFLFVPLLCFCIL